MVLQMIHLATADKMSATPHQILSTILLANIPIAIPNQVVMPTLLLQVTTRSLGLYLAALGGQLIALTPRQAMCRRRPVRQAPALT